MNKIIWVIVAVVVILLGILIFNRPAQPSRPEPIPMEPPAAVIPEIDNDLATGTQVFRTRPEAATRSFTVIGSNFKFSLAEIKVKRGDTVKIIFQNQSGTHNWQVDEFKAATKILKAGETETIEFVADQKGTFEYYCVVGEHRQMGMEGKLVVE